MGWDARTAHGGEVTDEARAFWRELLATGDIPDYTRAVSKPAECPSAGTKCDLAARPDHDSGCMCFSWTGCSDPDCDHPACEGARWRQFGRDYERFDHTDRVLLWTSAWEPWEEHGRGKELLAEYRHGRDSGDPRWKRHDASRLLRELEKHRAGITPVTAVGETYLDQELALVDAGTPLECRWVCHTSARTLAYAIARGARELEDTTAEGRSVGGLITGQIRLAALAIDHAPEGYQAALF